MGKEIDKKFVMCTRSKLWAINIRNQTRRIDISSSVCVCVCVAFCLSVFVL